MNLMTKTVPWAIASMVLGSFNPASAASFQGLGFLSGGTFSNTNGVSADGSVVVGQNTGGTNPGAFIWDSTKGMRSLQSVLVDDFKLNNLTGWKLTLARGISADGLTIVGNGINPNGQGEAWVARLDAEPVPEPLTILGTGVVLGAIPVLKKEYAKRHKKK